MSYLSSSENVGFSGIPQNITETSCATQYKMAVEGVSGNCNDVNMFMQDSSADDQAYIAHANDNYYHSKFKIDPNELYTFHDSDVIAGEITVSHTEDQDYVLTDDIEQVELSTKQESSGSDDVDIMGGNCVTNGDQETEVITNGHYTVNSMTIPGNVIPKQREKKVNATANHKTKPHKTPNTKAPKAKRQSKELNRKKSVIERRSSVHNPKNQISNVNIASNNITSTSIKTSVSNVDSSTTSVPASNTSALAVPSLKSASETFLDVFKREQGLVESPPLVIKTESPMTSAPPPIKATTAAKKQMPVKASQPKAKRGRGPAVHEALQRIPPKRAIPVQNRPWHAPGDELFQCGPLDDNPRLPFGVESSSDDDHMPDIDTSVGPVCVEETAAKTRSARLALRRAALRRHVSRADAALKLNSDHRRYRTLAFILKKQLGGQGASCRLPAQTVSNLLASRGLTAVLTSQERRRLREGGWSGGESGSNCLNKICAEERCTQTPVPCGRYCLAHVTMDPEQRLYAECAAVFAGGARCMQPLLPLQDQTPLCTEHAWKRDNYDKLLRDGKPKKLIAARKNVWPPPQRPPRRPKRRRRPIKNTRPTQQSLSDVNVCSNSSAYDSSEDTAMGALSETEYMAPASHELEVEVGHVPPDDILDPAVLSQIPDEAFTEFFNQAEGGAPFAESSELAAALEAVLDERALDSIADCVFTPQQLARNKIHHVQASVGAQPSTPS